jgi:hypothetical protein
MDVKDFFTMLGNTVHFARVCKMAAPVFLSHSTRRSDFSTIGPECHAGFFNARLFVVIEEE